MEMVFGSHIEKDHDAKGRFVPKSCDMPCEQPYPMQGDWSKVASLSLQ